MRKIRILLFLGLWVAVLPYLGFPHSWKNVLFTVSGLTLVYFGYMSYRELKAREGGNKNFDNFSENSDFTESEVR